MTRPILLLTLCATISAADPTGYWLLAEATAYSPHDAIDAGHAVTADFVTADGTDWRTTPYGVAIHRYQCGEQKLPYVPYGTRVWIPLESGYLMDRQDRWFRVDDTGGSLTTEAKARNIVRIDLRYRTEFWATKFGRKLVWVWVEVTP